MQNAFHCRKIDERYGKYFNDPVSVLACAVSQTKTVVSGVTLGRDAEIHFCVAALPMWHSWFFVATGFASDADPS